MKNSSERKRYKTNPNFDAYLLYLYESKTKRNDLMRRDKADMIL